MTNFITVGYSSINCCYHTYRQIQSSVATKKLARAISSDDLNIALKATIKRPTGKNIATH